MRLKEKITSILNTKKSKKSRLPRVRDTADRFTADGEKLCRNCECIVGSGRQSYCSQTCMLAFNRNNSWYWVRKDVLKRDRYSCRICKTRRRKKDLDVDHIIPLQMGGEPYDKKNLRVVCKECHKAKTKLDRWALRG